MHPLKNFAITAPFDWRPPVGSPVYNIYKSHGLIGHNGVDYAPRSSDWNIYSICSGVVSRRRFEANGLGHHVVILADQTFRGGKVEVIYGHMASQSPLAEGSRVSQGDIIGVVGSSGLVTGAHLHIGLGFVNKNPKDGYFGWSLNPTEFINELGQVLPTPPLVESDKEKKYYTVQRGGWRSQVISEIIGVGIWGGTWQERQPFFDSLNPVTPQGGWKAGDKVVIEMLPPKKTEVIEASPITSQEEAINPVAEPTTEQAPEKPEKPTEIIEEGVDTPLDVEIIDNFEESKEMDKNVVDSRTIGQDLKRFAPYGASAQFAGVMIGTIVAYQYQLPVEVALAVAGLAGFIINGFMIVGVKLLDKLG